MGKISIDNFPVRPVTYKLDDGDKELANKLSVPSCLTQFWTDYGYGFFNEDTQGNRLCEAINRLLPPDEVQELSSSFEPNLPFFEIHDSMYFCLTGSGAVVLSEEGGVGEVKIADSVEQFFSNLLQNPDFYIEIIEQSGENGESERIL